MLRGHGKSLRNPRVNIVILGAQQVFKRQNVFVREIRPMRTGKPAQNQISFFEAPIMGAVDQPFPAGFPIDCLVHVRHGRAPNQTRLLCHDLLPA